MKHKFTKVSEYLKAGSLSIGCLLENPVKETEKAIAFGGIKHNQYGYPYNGTYWLPKSQLLKLENDYYTHPDAPSEMWFCPSWLWQKNRDIGQIV